MTYLSATAIILPKSLDRLLYVISFTGIPIGFMCCSLNCGWMSSGCLDTLRWKTLISSILHTITHFPTDYKHTTEWAKRKLTYSFRRCKIKDALRHEANREHQHHKILNSSVSFFDMNKFFIHKQQHSTTLQQISWNTMILYKQSHFNQIKLQKSANTYILK